MIIRSSILTALDPSELRGVLGLTKHGSAFNRAIVSGVGPAWRGLIATVSIEGEIVGWCRTEEWTDDAGCPWETLEAFVKEDYRDRGIAVAAARALYADHFHDTGAAVAVFAPSMLLVARSAGLHPTLFRREERWVRA